MKKSLYGGDIENEIYEKCYPDVQMYIEKSRLLGARRKRLWEDHERDEADKLDNLYKHFMKNFRISRDEINEDVLMVFVLSNNYYSSTISICEMGAAWVKTKHHIPKISLKIIFTYGSRFLHVCQKPNCKTRVARQVP